MRVIAGKAKGFRLKAPKGYRTRPTSDLVRGVIFSMLESLIGAWSRVLDLYAGSGALGIEALSRGAERVDFVERDPRCCAILEGNLKNTGFSAQAHVYCYDVGKGIDFLTEGYDLILMDPPYDEPQISDMIEKIASSAVVKEGSTVVVEHSRRHPLSDTYGKLRLVKSRRHGDTCVSIFM